MSLDNLLDKKFIETDDLRKRLTEILNQLPKDEEIIITQHGKPRAVLMDIKKYQKIKEYIQRRTTQTYR